MIKPLRSVAFALLSVLPLAVTAKDELVEGFVHPPADARPQTWWHWMNGNISKEGITADLEAMHRIGLGGAQIFNAYQGEKPGPVKVFGPEWFALVQHAIHEADRLGLKLTMHNCAGWSESGGPWVTPPDAMQRVVWSELRVHGGQPLALDLPQPTMIVADYCQDIAVLAFPATPTETKSVTELAPAITTSTPNVDVTPLLTGHGGAVVELPLPKPHQPEVITLDFRAPQRWGSVRFVGREFMAMPLEGRIEASDDGQAFKALADFPLLAKGRNHPSTLVTFPETSARYFRLVITKVDPRAHALVLTAIDFGGTRLPRTEERAGYRAGAGLAFLPDAVPAADAIAAARVVDLTAQVKNGHLDWQAPAGDWTIVRFAHTLTGQMNAPAPDGGRGWEADKMNRAAIDAHFAALMGKVIAAAGPLAGKTFTSVLADSWEAGSENWTPAFRAEFLRRRGYDPLPFLPVLTGRVVGNDDQSQRFLWDYRRTIGDLIAQNHYAEFRELCRQHGMTFISEAPGIGMPTVADELECKGRTDIPMGEFWMDGHNDSKETASAAHVYGKRLAAAEAFTAKTPDAKWMKTPFDHKMLGDLHFATGINEYVFHRYAHQPWLDRVPGMTMGPWGTNFERTNTWWEQARAWMAYITRCQYLLQRGSPVADVAYFYGEDVPNTLARNEPTLPAGYDYDAVNAEVLLTRLSVRDGRLVLPDGVSYAALLLADSDRMTPAVLQKIGELVHGGAIVIGRRPARSPSLVGYPACDAEVTRLATEIWGDCDGTTVKQHAYGQGRVFCGVSAAEALAALRLAPDFSASGPGKFVAIHRRMDGAEVYFVSSQNPQPATATLTFRVSGEAPELWYADSGRRERTATFTQQHGTTSIPVHFDPAGSVFVVFRGSARGVDSVVSVTRGGADATADAAVTFNESGGLVLTTAVPGDYEVKTASGATHHARVGELPASEVAGSWTVRFPSGWGAPAEVAFPTLTSWTQNANEGVKYFSGTATYARDLDVPAAMLGGGKAVWLDLGTVKDLAEVKINGREIGILWKPPFRADVTKLVHAGANTLEVRITNLWPNRLIGDQRLPVEQRHTWATFNPFKPDDPLLDSGLLGPVRLTGSATVPVSR